jgi:alkylation response protein AidB-like acyl-CoA dehydrogenase
MTQTSRLVADPLDELQDWLAATWDPELTLREWWALLADGRWAAPEWPVEWHGRGLNRASSASADRIIRAHGAITASGGAGRSLAGPTILAHATDEQKARLLPGIARGTTDYCQLFSEPGSGSDLASLSTRAERDGDEWVITGQKVWTSGAIVADHGILLARTDPDVAKHAGISYFVIDMLQDGVDARPLREMTGREYFCEVFLDGARVPAADLIGGEGNGWAVAATTLAFERNLSAADSARSTARPGPLGDLDRRAGDFSSAPTPDVPGITASERLTALARQLGRDDHPIVRQDLVRLHILERLNTWTAARSRALALQGRELPGAPNLAKMIVSHGARLSRQLTFDILGAAGTNYAYDPDGEAAVEAATGIPGLADHVEQALFASAIPVYGGSDQIQRNIVGERILGLAREPDPYRGVPYRDVPRDG